MLGGQNYRMQPILEPNTLPLADVDVAGGTGWLGWAPPETYSWSSANPVCRRCAVQESILGRHAPLFAWRC